jgi:hypothetical protein
MRPGVRAVVVGGTLAAALDITFAFVFSGWRGAAPGASCNRSRAG